MHLLEMYVQFTMTKLKNTYFITQIKSQKVYLICNGCFRLLTLVAQSSFYAKNKRPPSENNGDDIVTDFHTWQKETRDKQGTSLKDVLLLLAD